MVNITGLLIKKKKKVLWKKLPHCNRTSSSRADIRESFDWKWNENVEWMLAIDISKVLRYVPLKGLLSNSSSGEKKRRCNESQSKSLHLMNLSSK